MDPVLGDFPFRSVLSLSGLIDLARKAQAHPEDNFIHLGDDFEDLLAQAPELCRPLEDREVLKKHSQLVNRLLALLFPPVFWNSEPFAVLIPFNMDPVWASPPFRSLFVGRDGCIRMLRKISAELFRQGRLVRAYLFILAKFYDVHLDLDYPLVCRVTHPESGLDRFYRYNLDFRFVDVEAKKPLPQFSPEEMEDIKNHVNDPDYLLQILPPDMFEFRGFTVVQAVDVSESEVISAIERDLIDQRAILTPAGFQELQNKLRVLFQNPELVAGVAALQDEQVYLISKGVDVELQCVFSDAFQAPLSEFVGTPYEQALHSDAIIRIPDAEKEPSLQGLKPLLQEAGLRCKLIAPLYFQDEAIGVLEVGTLHPGELTSMDAMLLTTLQPVFSLAVKKALSDMDSQVQAVIKQTCTAIHPSVEWRFRRAAFKYLKQMRSQGEAQMEPIVFPEVFPLYGACDIRGSSEARNRAIGADLVEHLGLAREVLSLADSARPQPFLRELINRIDRLDKRVRGGLGSGDENLVINFLHDEVASSFEHLRGLGPKVLRAVETYQAVVDPNLGTVYGQRRQFEQSVSLLNDRLLAYLDQEEAEQQAAFPHYFERHRSDGVDYIIYLGSSLMEKSFFSPLFLKNLRLWQIMAACGLAWQARQVTPELPMTLEVAQLILVQNSPLAISFRFDERRFDVDGAYNVRYEIIKSRLDKAVVKDSGERLTQPGMIALVYTQTAEAVEIRHHLEFLQAEGYLKPGLERLDLDDLPGVQGLKAMRVGINLENQDLARRVERLTC